MIFEYAINIRSTKEAAWNLIEDIERRPEWVHFMDKCIWLDKTPEIIGSTYNEEEVFLGFHLNVKYKIIEYIPYEKMVSKCDMFPFYQKIQIVIQENKNNTIQAKLTIDGDLGVLGVVPNFIIKNRVNAIVQPLVNKFAEILDSHSKAK